MKYSYGKKSLLTLRGADSGLQRVFHTALNLGLIDISILEGHRPEEEQNRLFKGGKSKVQYPNSKHNKTPSEALDAAPYVGGKASFDYRHCIYLAGIICAVGTWLGIKIRWGGNWDMDGEPLTDQGFQDLVHYEVIK